MSDATGNDDLELDADGNIALSQSPVRKNIALKLKGKGVGRGRRGGRGRKAGGTSKIPLGEDLEIDANEAALEPGGVAEMTTKEITMDDDITKLETPTFTTLERGPPEPLHQNAKLKWGHKVNLIGEKVVNPMIHCCEKCLMPILIYGRMIPCKHVFCLECAKKFDKTCPRCRDKVSRVEQSALGSVFICTYGGARHSVGGCKRTYLSQRDLQAHINHRHLRQPPPPPPAAANPSPTASSAFPQSISPSASAHILNARDPRNHLVHEGPVGSQSHTPPPHIVTQAGHMTSQAPPPHMHSHIPDYAKNAGGVLPLPDPSTRSNMPPPQHLAPPPTGALLPQPNRPAHPFTHPPPTQYPSPIPVVSNRSNLITVPIQDDNSSSPHISHPGHHMSPYASHSPQHQPPPVPPQQTYPPPAHHYQTPPPPVYNQPPQNFSQPPPTHLPPPPQAMHNPSPPMYHPGPPPNYNPQQIRGHPMPRQLPLPQRFPGPGSYDHWGGGGQRPPPPHQPGPRPMQGPPIQHGPEGFRPPYYQQ